MASYFFDHDQPDQKRRVPVGANNKLHGIYHLSADRSLRLAQCQDFPKIPSPADDGIRPLAGDDTSPPNSVKPGTLNALATHVLANVGFSTADKKAKVSPSHVDYALTVVPERGGGFGLAVQLMLEYANPHPGQSMVVWAKKLKQFVSDERKPEQALTLIDTKFRDYRSAAEAGAAGEEGWVDISTDVRFAAEAEAVAQAVMTSDSGQTAGTLKTDGEVEAAKLGPVGTRGRIVLTYRAPALYSYQQMAVPGQSLADAAGRVLVPLAVHLPHARLNDRRSGAMQVGVRLSVPAGASLLRLSEPANHAAFHHLKQTSLQAPTLLVPESLGGGGPSAFDQSWPCLPPTPWCLFFWLSLPGPQSSAAAAANGAAAGTGESVVTLYEPSGAAQNLQRVGCPGNTQGHLLRAEVVTASNQVPADVVRVVNHVNISDASGSTGCRADDSTVRERLNAIAVTRLLKRLEAVPTLVAKGLLRPQDIWSEELYVFDHTVKTRRSVLLKVADLADPAAVAALLAKVAQKGRAAAPQNAAAAPLTADLTAMVQSGMITMLQARGMMPAAPPAVSGGAGGAGSGGAEEQLCAFVDTLRGIRPSGATSFVAPARRIAAEYADWSRRVEALAGGGRTLLKTTHVNFDTDGGNNCGECYKAMRAMVGACDVVGGFVNGFGAWVDQDCASKVAKILGGPCLLSTSVPAVGSEGTDLIFRRDMHHWLQALRTVPVVVKVHGGSVSWQARQRRSENRADLLFLTRPRERKGVKFGPPDVSLSTDFTAATVEGFRAGDAFTAHLLARAPAGVDAKTALRSLAEELVVSVNGVRARVQLEPEPLAGVFLGSTWLTALAAAGGKGARGVVPNKATLCRRLRERLEDDLSFNWNLVTVGGSTAYLGRSKTAHRPPVLQAKQPDEPSLEADLSKYAVRFNDRHRSHAAYQSSESDDEEDDSGGGGWGAAGGMGGSWGGGGGMPRPTTARRGLMASAMSAAPMPPAAPMFRGGAPVPQRARGGGMRFGGGRRAARPEAQAMKKKSKSRSRRKPRPGRGGGRGGGGRSRGRGVGGRGRGRGRGRGPSRPRPGLWGAAPESKSAAMEDEAELAADVAAVARLACPAQLLAMTNNLRLGGGAADPLSALEEALTLLKVLVARLTTAAQQQQPAQAEPEDELLGELLGAKPPAPAPAKASSSLVSAKEQLRHCVRVLRCWEPLLRAQLASIQRSGVWRDLDRLAALLASSQQPGAAAPPKGHGQSVQLARQRSEERRKREQQLAQFANKTRWPELAGQPLQSALDTIRAQRPSLAVQPLPDGSMVTMDHRMDRVRVFHTTDFNGMQVVSGTPRCG